MAWQLRKVIENKKEEYIMQDKSKVKLIERNIEKLLIQKKIRKKIW